MVVVVLVEATPKLGYFVYISGSFSSVLWESIFIIQPLLAVIKCKRTIYHSEGKPQGADGQQQSIFKYCDWSAPISRMVCALFDGWCHKLCQTMTCEKGKFPFQCTRIYFSFCTWQKFAFKFKLLLYAANFYIESINVIKTTWIDEKISSLLCSNKVIKENVARAKCFRWIEKTISALYFDAHFPWNSNEINEMCVKYSELRIKWFNPQLIDKFKWIEAVIRPNLSHINSHAVFLRIN